MHARDIPARVTCPYCDAKESSDLINAIENRDGSTVARYHCWCCTKVSKREYA